MNRKGFRYGFCLFTIAAIAVLGMLGSPKAQAQVSIDLDSLLNGQLVGTYQKISITGVKNAASLEFDNVTITADTSGVQSITLDSGTFTMAGLQVSINDASYDVNAKQFTATATIAFPIDLTVAAQFSIDSSGVNLLGGRVDLPPFQVGKVGVSDAYIEYSSTNDTLGGGATASIPGIGGDPETPVAISASIEFRDGEFNMFQISATGLRIPLGDTGAFLDGIGVSGTNLSDSNNMSFGGEIDIVAGPEVAGTNTFAVDTTGTVWPTKAWIDINGTAKLYGVTTGTANFAYRPPANITVGAGVNFIDVFTAQCNASFINNQVSGSATGNLQIPNDVPVVGGYSVANAQAWLSGTDFGGSVSITITPEIPKKCVPEECTNVPYGYPCPTWSKPFKWCSGSKQVCTPEVCTPAVPAVKASASFRFSNGKFSFTTKRAGQDNPWELAYNEVYSADGDAIAYQFMGNWERIAKANTWGQNSAFRVTPQGEPVTQFTVGDNVPAAIFRITYENPNVSGVDATLTTPDGTVLNLNSGPLPSGFAEKLGYGRFHPEAKEAFFMLIGPSAGGYTLTINNPGDLGEYSAELLAQNNEPTLTILSVIETQTPGQFEVKWNDEDLDDNATVSFFIDTDDDHFDGQLLATTTEDDANDSILLDTTGLNVAPGWYYILASINDGRNAPDFVYYDQPIYISNGDHPDPVTTIHATARNHGFEIEWEASPSDDVDAYSVIWTDNDDTGLFEFNYSVDKNQHSAVIDGLENGVPYLVSVVAVDHENQTSAPLHVVRVVPRPSRGYTPPRIQSTPDPDATAGYTYVYLPKFFDGDAISAPELIPLEFAREPDRALYEWSILDGPDGLTIDPDTGFIAWTPTEDQVGLQHVSIQLTENVFPGTDENGDVFPAEPMTDRQDFDILVLPSDNLSGIETHSYDFLTLPLYTAYRTNLYQYQVQLFVPIDASVQYLITNGPNGMSVDENGLVTWLVPENSEGAEVAIAAIVDGEHILEQKFFLDVKDLSEASASHVSDDLWHGLK